MPERSALSLSTVATELTLPEPAQKVQRLARDAPAMSLFTNLGETRAISVLATTQIDRALTRMIDTGVRFLFVVDADSRLVGSISSYDIAGEKPMRFLQQRGGHFGSASRSDVLVRDIMLPVDAWRVLDFSLARRATVGQVAETIERTGQRHLVVVEPAAGGTSRAIVRGIFSATQIERALGTSLDLEHTKQTFAEIEHALEHHHD